MLRKRYPVMSNELLSRAVIQPHVLMDVREIDPLHDVRWPDFVRQHPAGSVFHTASWLEVLRRTYGYEPAAMSISDLQGNLVSALVFCRINSWMTGKRLVSLPFSDHCEPLVSNEAHLLPLITKVQQVAMLAGYEYVEFRSKSCLTQSGANVWESDRFCFHVLDLRTNAEEVFGRLHRDCIQRKIRRAEKESLTVVDGPIASNLLQFYRLVVRTRRRQGLLPQPFRWFRNVVDCMGSAVNIRIASKGSQAIAGLLTIENNKCVTYKYGASDERFHKVGGMPYLFWLVIQDAIGRGFQEFDLGRSDINNKGLVSFKDRLGAARSYLSYWRSPASAVRQSVVPSRSPDFLRRACVCMPDNCLTTLGALVYPHMG